MRNFLLNLFWLCFASAFIITTYAVLKADSLAQGSNFLWGTIPLALWFLYYQVKLLINLFKNGFFQAFFNNEAPIGQRLSWALVIGSGVLMTSFILYLNFMYHYGGGVPDWLAGNDDSIVKSTTTLSKVWTVVMALSLGTVVSTLLIAAWSVGCRPESLWGHS